MKTIATRRAVNGSQELKIEASFSEIFDACESKIHAVFIFLGMLELIQQQLLSIVLGEGNNNFWLSAEIEN